MNKSRSFSKKPFVIPVFIPDMGCPHRCIFCDQGVITGVKRFLPTRSLVNDSISSFLKYVGDRSSVQIAFYGGNFLGLSEQYIIYILDAVSPFLEKGIVDSIRFSTRPDTVNLDTLSIIKPYLVKTVELGVQSMNDYVLRLSQRGHSSYDTIRAVDMLKNGGYTIGAQMMLGLPGDNDERAMKTAKSIASFSPDFVRIYPTIVIRGSLLSNLYRHGFYDPMQLDNCILLTKRIFLFFKQHEIPVVRMGLHASENLNDRSKVIAGPYHPSFGHIVYSKIFLDAIKLGILQINNKPRILTVKVHPKNVSRVQGLRCSNIKLIKSEFNFESVLIEQSISIDEEHLDVCGHSIKVY